jgi:hypothetical protein
LNHISHRQVQNDGWPDLAWYFHVSARRRPHKLLNRKLRESFAILVFFQVALGAVGVLKLRRITHHQTFSFSRNTVLFAIFLNFCNLVEQLAKSFVDVCRLVEIVSVYFGWWQIWNFFKLLHNILFLLWRGYWLGNYLLLILWLLDFLRFFRWFW